MAEALEPGNIDTGAPAAEPQNTPAPEPEGNAQGTLAGAAGAAPQTGAPETYDFTGTLPEGAELNEAIAEEFGEMCRGMNLSNDQANELAKYGYGYAQNIAKAVEESRIRQIVEAGENAKKELGAEFGETIRLVGTAVEAMEREYPGIRQALNETGAGNSLPIIRMLAKVGTLLREDPGVNGAPGGGKVDNMYSNTDWSKI